MTVKSRKRLRKMAQADAAKRYRDRLAGEGYVNKRINIAPHEVPLWDEFVQNLERARDAADGGIRD